jgi:hypothetical protein
MVTTRATPGTLRVSSLIRSMVCWVRWSDAPSGSCTSAIM